MPSVRFGECQLWVGSGLYHLRKSALPKGRPLSAKSGRSLSATTCRSRDEKEAPLAHTAVHPLPSTRLNLQTTHLESQLISNTNFAAHNKLCRDGKLREMAREPRASRAPPSCTNYSGHLGAAMRINSRCVRIRLDPCTYDYY